MSPRLKDLNNYNSKILFQSRSPKQRLNIGIDVSSVSNII